jgi:hypothetical protein
LADFLNSSPLKLLGQMNQNLVGSITKSANPKQELPVVAMFVNGSGRKEQSLYRGPPIDASYQVSVHLAKWFQRRRFFRNHPWPTQAILVSDWLIF